MKRKWQRNWKQKLMKKLATPVIAGMMLFSSYNTALANPSGGVVTAGAAAISTNGSTMTVNQTTNKAAINWQSFGIGSGETVRFIQPSTSSVALNRVVGGNASAIYGTLSANGKVFLVNSSGILFAPGSQVNVGGLVASTLDLSDSDFLKGNYTFAKNGAAGSVVNQGTIRTADGGYVAFLGPQVRNQGLVAAQAVGLAAGDKVSLDFDGDKLLSFRVDTQAAGAAATNSGSLLADGGTVVMSTGTKDALLNTVVNNTGLIQARTVKNGASGKIILEGGTVNVSGTLDASGLTAGQTGGVLKVLGDNVTLASGSLLNASGDAGGGTILVGGAYQGGAGEYAATRTTVAAGATLSADAATTGNGGQVVVWSNKTTDFGGTITARGGSVSGDGGSVETSGKQTLTVKGTAKVSTLANHGKTGNWLLDPYDFTVAPSGGDTTGATISTWLAGNNVTIQTGAAGSSATGGEGQSKTGNSGTEGNININDAITWTSDTTLTLSAYNNIYINRSITNTGAGSLALVYGQKAVNADNTSTYSINAPVNLTAGQHFSTKLGTGGTSTQYTVITSLDALQGINASTESRALNYFLGADIDASATSGWNGGAGFTPIGKGGYTFKGAFDGGSHTISGLFINRPGESNVGLFGYAEGNKPIANLSLVNANITGSGYVGILAGGANNQISNVNATGSVTGSGQDVGGLVGHKEGSISNSYATVSVNGYQYVGGLVGINIGTISNSYATGSVTGNRFVGGLAGYQNNGTISNSYATGSVTGTDYVGGLLGRNMAGGTVSNSYATGSGGLVGDNNGGNISTSYWHNGIAAFTQGSYTGFDFTDTWYMVDGSTRPFLRSEYSTNITNAHQLQLMAMDLTANYTLGKNIDIGELTQTSGMWRTSSTADVSGNYGFVPIGTGNTEATTFSGSFDGGGHTISGLTINRPQENYVGLFGSAYKNEYDPLKQKKIANVGLVGASITGKDNVGALAGYTFVTSITNSYVTTGSVIGNSNVGGLVGNAGPIANSYAAANVTGVSNVGGLAGKLTALAEATYATGDVTGTEANVGGLAGYVDTYGVIQKSYASGKVTGKGKVGGLVGSLNTKAGGSGIHDSYATGSVTGTGTDSYDYVGGLAGYVDGSGIHRSYSTGLVSGKFVAGLVGGGNLNTISSSYWNTETSGVTKGFGSVANMSGMTGRTTKTLMNELHTSEAFSNSNTSTIWGSVYADGVAASYPYLKWRYSTTPQVVSGTLTADNVANASGKTIQVAANGSGFGGTATGANGFYYLLLDNNTIANNAAVLSYWSGQGSAAKYATAANQSLTGLDITAGKVTASSSGALDITALLATAKGGIDAGTRYFVSGGNIAVEGDLNVNAGGAVTQSGFLTVSGVTTVNAGANDITLNNAANNFTGRVALTGNNVTLRDGNALWLGGSTISGDLNVTAGGDVTQTGGLTVTGATTVNAVNGATKYDITLGYYDNDFTGAVSLTGNNVLLQDKNALVLGASIAGGTLQVQTGGAVTQTGMLTVTGATTVTAAAGQYDITLNNADNDFTGAVKLTGKNVTLRDGNALWLGGSTISGDLNVTAGGDVTQTVGLTVTGTTTVNAGSHDISLWNIANNFTGAVTLTGQNVSLRDANALTLGAVTAPGKFELSAGGTITADSAVSTSLFDLKGGSWQQVASTLPSFSATNFRLSGGSFLRALSGEGTSGSPYQVNDIYGLQGIGSSSTLLTKHYCLANNIDASGTSAWNGGAGFKPIGTGDTEATAFTGNFNGGGKTISGLFINRPTQDYVGLFGSAGTGMIENVQLMSADVTGQDRVGALAGYTLTSSNIYNSHATGSVTGRYHVGGLAGYTESMVENSHAAVSVIGNGNVGGLVGYAYDGYIFSSYATGSVTGTANNVGGLVGFAYNGAILRSYATGSVIGQDYLGGLVGVSVNSISSSYATGSVTGDAYVGGLVGSNSSDISSSYATGSVTGNTNVGGLVGYNSGGTVTNSYWDRGTSGQSGSAGGTGLTSAQMKGAGSFSGWTDLEDGSGNKVWYFYDGLATPLLKSFLTPLTVTVAGTNPTVEYNRTAYTSLGAVTYSIADPALSGTLSYGSVVNNSFSANAGNAGTYQVGGLYSGQQGYAITYAGATGLTITPKTLTAGLTGTVEKVYDGTTAATLTIGNFNLNGAVEGDAVAVASSNMPTYIDKNVGAGKQVTVTILSLSGAAAGNYQLAVDTISGNLGKITPATLTISATSATKVYDGTTTSAATPTYNGLVAGDSLGGLTQTYGSKNVLGANGSTLNVSGGYTLTDGNNGNNYTVATQSAAGTITPKTLTSSLTGTVEKIYDGTTAATLTGANYAPFSGIVGGDEVSINIATSGSYADKNVANGKQVTVSGLGLSGTDAGNYQLASTLSGNVGKITPATLTITATTDTKVYDGTTSSSATPTYTGLKDGDTLNPHQVYGDKNVLGAAGSTLHISSYYLADGNNGGNYTVTTHSATGTITPKTLTAGLTGTVEKVYDGTNTATLTGANYASLSGIIGSDAVSLNIAISGSFADKNVNLNGDKAVSVTGLTLSGADAGNYQLAATSISGNVGKITPKTLTAGLTGTVEKVYDGTNTAKLTGANYAPFSGIVGGDEVSINIATSGSYAEKNVNLNGDKVVTVSGLSLSGGDAGNYQLASTLSGNVGKITPKTLTAGLTGTVEKVYDGTNTATLTSANYTALSGIVGSDAVSLNIVTSGSYADKNVNLAGDKAVTVTGLTLTGAAAGNYTLASTTLSGNVGKITPATLTTNLTGTVEKVYDGTKAGTLTSANYTALAGIFHSDDVTLAIATSGLYVDKNAGEGKSVTVTGLGLSGSAAANYRLASTLSGNVGKITPKTLTTGLTGAVEKVYDGTNTATLTGGNYMALTGIIGGDAVSLDIATSGQYADKNVNLAGDKAVTVSGFGLSGADAGNYQLASTLSGNIGKITPATLTITANNASRQIGVENPVFSSTHTGLVAGDNLASLTGLISYATTATKDSPAGTYAITPSGLTSGNYTITWVNGVLMVNRPTDAYVSALGTVAGLAAAPPPMPMLAATGVTRINATAPASGTTSGATAGTTDASETPAGSTGTPASANPAGPPTITTQVSGLPLTFTGPGINTGGHPLTITAEQE